MQAGLNAVSRLKGIETTCDMDMCEKSFSSLNAVSRLKGIETRQNKAVIHLLPEFECSFPFEGNWNLWNRGQSAALLQRLNAVSRLKGIETSGVQQPEDLAISPFECSFPFEGNWN